MFIIFIVLEFSHLGDLGIVLSFQFRYLLHMHLVFLILFCSQSSQFIIELFGMSYEKIFLILHLLFMGHVLNLCIRNMFILSSWNISCIILFCLMDCIYSVYNILIILLLYSINHLEVINFSFILMLSQSLNFIL